MKKVIVFILCCIIIVLGIARFVIAIYSDEPKLIDPIFTINDFLEYLDTHDTSLSRSDFDYIEDNVIEGFILYYTLTLRRIRSIPCLREEFDYYIERLSNNENDVLITPYRVRELVVAESTRSEYLDFIQRFFEEIDIDAEFTQRSFRGVRSYEYSLSRENRITFNFSQTSNIRNLKISRNDYFRTGSHYKIEISDTSFMTIVHVDIYLSRNGKYLMYLDGTGSVFSSFDEVLNIIRIFTTMED